MDSCELTILMPSLNEAETLAICIQKAKHFLQTEHIQGEILIADNGSTDGSQAIAQAQGARVISVATRGYGAALRGGIQAARGTYIIMGDADDSYDFLSLKPFVERLRAGNDLVMGNRFLGGIKAGAMPFLNRYLGNPILTFVGRLFYKSRVGDFHCGLRGFRRDAFLKLDLQGDGMEFASEMIIKATLENYQITEVPTCLFPDGRSRRPHLRPWRDGWRHLRLLLLFSPRWLFLYPGIGLFLLGCFLMAVIGLGPVSIGQITFDIHTMLFGGMFMVVGWQSVCFAVFAHYITTAPIKFFSTGHLLPRLLKQFTLEKGLLAGAVLMLLGMVGACYSLLRWQREAFGPLSPNEMMRLVIPATTAIILGMQLAFSSFFMSMLGWHYQKEYDSESGLRK